MKLTTFQNKDYKPGANVLKRLFWYVVNALVFNSYLFPSYYVKVKLLRLFGAKVGSGVIIKPKVNIKYPWRLTIGNDVWIGEKVWVDNLADVIIGNDVCISQEAYLLTGNHNYKLDTFDLIIGDIELKDKVWIGAKAIVCPGVVCEKGSILSVGSVATERLLSDIIYQGIPAKEKKHRFKNR
jgi:putative colanic acid biosynthesis acetyltransferase WcaF